MIPFLSVKSQSIRLRVKPNFPALLLGGTAIAISKTNGIYTVNLNYEELQEAALGTGANDYIAIWDSASGQFFRIKIVDLVALLPVGIPEPPANALMYGRVNTPPGAWARAVALAGDTMTGNLSISPAAGAASLILNAPGVASNQAVHNFYDNGVLKWQIGKLAGNQLFCYDAVAVGQVWNITGGTQVVDFVKPPTVTTVVPSTDSTTKAASTAFVQAAIVSASKIKSVIKQTFINSGTYTPTPGMAYAIIEAVGGGGGGGTAQSASATQVWGGGGGGAGGYSQIIATAAAIGASQVVTIGAAGAGGVAPLNNGSAGGNTSVGALCIAVGGAGGLKADVSAALPAGGAGGAAGTGNVVAAGASGFFGTAQFTNLLLMPSGNGGNSFFGGGAQGVAAGGGSVQAGNAAGNYGSGGSGGSVNQAIASTSGGAGSKGFVVITEFCTQ